MGMQLTRTHLVNDMTNVEVRRRGHTARLDNDMKATIQDLTRLTPRPFADNRSDWSADIPNIILRLPNGENIIFGQRQTITIGRSDETHDVNPTLDLGRFDGIQLGVSRCHAKLVYINNKYHIIDLNSTNKTKINDRKLTPHTTVPIYQHDKISFGKFEVYVEYIETKEAGDNEPIM